MREWRTKSVVLAVIVVLVVSTTGFQALAQEQGQEEMTTADAMIADAVFVRPLGIVAMGVGTVLFVASLPFTASGGNIKAAFRELMAEPTVFTFNRPLGVVDN